MAAKPDLAAVKVYLADSVRADDAEIAAALASEADAQASACRHTDDPAAYPAALAEALCRRVAHNLALRGLPLGVSAAISDSGVATNRVGGLDAEVARLEGPHRRVLFG